MHILPVLELAQHLLEAAHAAQVLAAAEEGIALYRAGAHCEQARTDGMVLLAEGPVTEVLGIGSRVVPDAVSPGDVRLSSELPGNDYQEVVARILRRRERAFALCARYSNVPDRSDETMTVGLTVAADGRTAGVRMGTSTSGGAELSECFTTVLRHVRWLPEPGRPLVVTFSLHVRGGWDVDD